MDLLNALKRREYQTPRADAVLKVQNEIVRKNVIANSSNGVETTDAVKEEEKEVVNGSAVDENAATNDAVKEETADQQVDIAEGRLRAQEKKQVGT